MKAYEITIVTKFYKTITVEAQNKEDAEDKAWDWVGENDALKNADVDTEVYFEYEEDV